MHSRRKDTTREEFQVEIKCIVCNKKIEITKMHKDFQKLRKDPSLPFICDFCNNKLRHQAREEQKPKQPI